MPIKKPYPGVPGVKLGIPFEEYYQNYVKRFMELKLDRKIMYTREEARRRLLESGYVFEEDTTNEFGPVSP